MKFMPGFTGTSGTRKTGVRSHCILLPVSYLRTIWPGPASVAPVVIPALAPSLDRSLKEDKSLCPVHALRYYLDRTKDLRKGKTWFLYLSGRVFRRIFSLPPFLPGSKKKKTVILCYQLSDEEAQNLHQVRAHDVRAFAASKAFQGGVSLDQTLSAAPGLL